MTVRHIRVAVPVPQLEALTYSVPDGIPVPVPGARVLVPLGSRIVSVSYGDLAPWPVAADGFGFSLVPRDTSAPFDADNGAISVWRKEGRSRLSLG